MTTAGGPNGVLQAVLQVAIVGLLDCGSYIEERHAGADEVCQAFDDVVDLDFDVEEDDSSDPRGNWDTYISVRSAG